MSIASTSRSGRVSSREGGAVGGESLAKLAELDELAAGVKAAAERAARASASLRELERSLLDRLLQIGHAAIEQFLALQGDADLGETTVDDDGGALHRSPEPVDHRCGRSSASTACRSTSTADGGICTRRACCGRSMRGWDSTRTAVAAGAGTYAAVQCRAGVQPIRNNHHGGTEEVTPCAGRKRVAVGALT